MDKKQWLFQQMRARNDKAIAEYLKAWEREKNAGNLANPVSQDDVAALFSLAVGEDLFDWFTAHGMPSSKDRTRVKVNVPKKAAAPKASAAKADPAPVPAVIGYDVSSHGYSSFYCDLVSSGKLSQFGKDARLLPLQFKLTDEVLDKINLLVLTVTPSYNHYDFDGLERKAVREFAERGGVVLALVRETDGNHGEASGSMQSLLKSYGATLFNAPGKAQVKAVLVKDLEGAGPFVDPACAAYACCTEDWSPVAIAQDDPKKVVSAVRPLGKGFLVFAQHQCASPMGGGKFVAGFPWDKVVLSRLKPVRRPDASFNGSTLDDAPYEARSSRLRFVSSVMPADELRKIAKMDDQAVEYLTRQFGKDAFDRQPAHNCIVGYSAHNEPAVWMKRLRELDAIELKFNAPERGIVAKAWIGYYGRHLLAHWDPPSFTEFGIGKYMAAAAYDELRRKGYVTDAEFGMSDLIAFARKKDPNFVLYDWKSKPVSRETPALSDEDMNKYYWGRVFALLEDLRAQDPGLFARYRQKSRGPNERKTSHAGFLDDLCEAYGSDWPRRWPAPENAKASGEKK